MRRDIDASGNLATSTRTRAIASSFFRAKVAERSPRARATRRATAMGGHLWGQRACSRCRLATAGTAVVSHLIDTPKTRPSEVSRSWEGPRDARRFLDCGHASLSCVLRPVFAACPDVEAHHCGSARWRVGARQARLDPTGAAHSGRRVCRLSRRDRSNGFRHLLVERSSNASRVCVSEVASLRSRRCRGASCRGRRAASCGRRSPRVATSERNGGGASGYSPRTRRDGARGRWGASCTVLAASADVSGHRVGCGPRTKLATERSPGVRLFDCEAGRARGPLAGQHTMPPSLWMLTRGSATARGQNLSQTGLSRKTVRRCRYRERFVLDRVEHAPVCRRRVR